MDFPAPLPNRPQATQMNCCRTFQEENKITTITKPPNLLFSIVQVSASRMIFQHRLIPPSAIRYQKPKTIRKLLGYYQLRIGVGF